MPEHTIVDKSVREPLLNPVDRISELLFGLLMALTFVGAISVPRQGDRKSGRCSRPRSAATSHGAWSMQ